MNITPHVRQWFVGAVATLALNQAIAADHSCWNKLSQLTAIVEKYGSVQRRTITPSTPQAVPSHTIRELGNWIPALPQIMRDGLPYLFAEDAARLSMAIYHETGRVVLISLFFPIVNIPSDRQDYSFDVLAEIVGTCVFAQPDTRSWLRSALVESWKIAAAQIDREERAPFNPTIQDVFDGTRIAVWGVPPDMWHILVMP